MKDFSGGNIKAIGGVEVLGGLGSDTSRDHRHRSSARPLAASGLALEQICAAIVQLRRGESTYIVAT